MENKEMVEEGFTECISFKVTGERHKRIITCAEI